MSNITIAACFQYVDPASGDTVIVLPTDDYVKLIGKKVCSQEANLLTYQRATAQLSGQVTDLRQALAAIQPYELPSLYPRYIASQVIALPLDQFTALLEQRFGELRNATGNPQDIFDAIAPFTSFNSLKSLGTPGGNLSSLPNWNSSVKLLSQGLTDAVVMIQDLRSAVYNLKLVFESNLCNAIEIQTQGTYAARILTLFFSGTIPSELVNTETGGALFRIEDQSGGFLYTRIDVKANLNESAGIAIDLTSAPLNFADDLHITGINSLTKPETGTTCQKFIELTVVNNASCPSVTISAGYTTLTVTFNHVEGTLTYSTQLWSANNVMLQAFNNSVSGPVTISNQFTGLSSGTTYKVRVQMITSESTRSCPFALVDTLPTVCPAPNNVSARIVIT